jgi:hypothetical protein
MSTPLFSRVCQILHLLALAVWLGSVAMSGVVAAIVFPLMGTLEPTLATYPSYEGNHATLTAGLVASKVFFTVDTIQFVCASLALGTMVVLIARGYSLNTLTRVFRVIFLCMTLALLSYHLFFFMPTLTRTLNGYWDFAKMGNTAQADVFKDRFLDSHTMASRMLGGLALMVLMNIVLAAWSLTASAQGQEPEPIKATTKKKARA